MNRRVHGVVEWVEMTISSTTQLLTIFIVQIFIPSLQCAVGDDAGARANFSLHKTP